MTGPLDSAVGALERRVRSLAERDRRYPSAGGATGLTGWQLLTRVLVSSAVGALILGGAGAVVTGLRLAGGEPGAWLGGATGVIVYLVWGRIGAGR